MKVTTHNNGSLKGKIFALVWIAIIITASTFGQTRFKGIPYIKNYTRQEYNASPFNWAVVQDAQGMIYVANNYLLMELDGKSWRFIVLKNRTVVRSLAIDEKGKVYVGGQDDFGYLAP